MFVWKFLACFLALHLASANPLQQSQRLTAETAPAATSLQEDQRLEDLQRLERSLSRLRRAVADLAYEEAADDMELAEINVFRPLFRYRAEVARQVKTTRQQQFG